MTNLIIELPTWAVHPNELSKIANKMQAIAVNIKEIIKNSGIVGKNNYNEFNVEADLSDQYDEFYITTVEAGEKISLCHIEVVTKEVAIGNDKEYLVYWGKTCGADMSDYKVGEQLSDYKRLGDTVYYYKEM